MFCDLYWYVCFVFRFLEKDDEDIPDKFVSLEEDEKILNTQTQFEHKYNFRFEEPDQEFVSIVLYIYIYLISHYLPFFKCMF